MLIPGNSKFIILALFWNIACSLLRVEKLRNNLLILIVGLIALPKKKKVKKQFFIYSIPPMSKPVGGRWKGDHDLEMLAFILISEETLDWFPFMWLSGNKATNWLKDWNFNQEFR